MVAKTWKKLLMAICIIAILFNIVNKLVIRTNLKEQVKSVLDSEPIFSIFNKDDDEIASSDYVDGVRNSNGTQNGSSDLTGTTEFNRANGQEGETIYNRQDGTTTTDTIDPNQDPSKAQEYLDKAIDVAGDAARTVDNNAQVFLTDETEENNRRMNKINEMTDGAQEANQPWLNSFPEIIDGIMQSQY